MALGDVIHQKKIVESMIKRSIDEEERRIYNYADIVEKVNSSLSQFTQEMLIDSKTRPELKRVSLIGRGRGLSVSLKKETPKSLMLSGKNIMVNPEFDVEKEIRERRVKMAETLMKTAHTVGELDKSVNDVIAKKTGRNGERTNEVTKAVSRISTNHYNEGHFSQRTIANINTQSPYSEESSYSNIIESVYDIRISSPKKFVEQIEKRLVSSPSKNANNKLKDMRERQFLRTEHFNKNVCEQNLGEKLVTDFVENDSLRLENIQQRREIMANGNLLSIPQPSSIKPSTITTKNAVNNKNYILLEKMISKPMINSIVLSHNLEQAEEPESPVLRLKKRLEMNSINCIFERETIVSHCEYEKNDEEMMRESLMEVQESFIVHRSVMEDLVRITQEEQCMVFEEKENHVIDYCRYLAVEKNINLLVTVKEMQLEKFGEFVNELRVYEEINTARFRLTEECVDSILELIRHSTEESKHLMLKAPYTSTLKKYITEKISLYHSDFEVNNMIEGFLSMIEKTVKELEGIDLILNRQPKIQDFVMFFDKIKFENLSMFYIGKSERTCSDGTIKTTEFIQKLREEIYKLLKIQE